MIGWEEDLLAEEACVLSSMALQRGRGGVLGPHLKHMERSFSRTTQRASSTASLEVGSCVDPSVDPSWDMGGMRDRLATCDG